ncbi:hypothetical protein M409DRAFT_50185 [Zasmidium cellare ATCC 36951]|uniref:Uncharacterized protein n=1 Tax=Zasmidium cellare ATCC 36951 TaxID=1080233 RepID=A0A6A6CZA9_ZASCE|nr:uncharacterized protein M409DRAFT_50185 [Zasmidium cellare ATCC 36951]KAF2172494.1 hypothetical protein M409DRAFT_50185 [Zasmidium cellare ATCC 36951]
MDSDWPFASRLHHTSLPEERRPGFREQVESLQGARQYQWELQSAWARLAARTPLAEEEVKEQKNAVKLCLKEINQISDDIKKEEAHLAAMEDGREPAEEILWARSKHWEIPEDLRPKPVSIIYLPVEFWAQRAEASRAREAAAYARTLRGRVRAGLRVVGGVFSREAWVQVFRRGEQESNDSDRSSSKREMDPREARLPVKLTLPSATTATDCSATVPATLSIPEARFPQTQQLTPSWHDSYRTLSPSTSEDSGPPASLMMDETMLEPESPPEPESLHATSAKMDISLPLRYAKYRGLVGLKKNRKLEQVGKGKGNMPEIEEESEDEEQTKIPEIEEESEGEEQTQDYYQILWADFGEGGFSDSAERFMRGTMELPRMQTPGWGLHTQRLKDIGKGKKNVRFDVEDDDEEAPAPKDIEADNESHNEDDDEDKENEPEVNVPKEEEDGPYRSIFDDLPPDSFEGSIPEHMTRGQILMPLEGEYIYNGEPDSGEEDDNEFEDQQQQIYDGDIDSDEEDDYGFFDESDLTYEPSVHSSLVVEVDEDSEGNWETESEFDGEEEDPPRNANQGVRERARGNAQQHAAEQASANALLNAIEDTVDHDSEASWVSDSEDAEENVPETAPEDAPDFYLDIAVPPAAAKTAAAEQSSESPEPNTSEQASRPSRPNRTEPNESPESGPAQANFFCIDGLKFDGRRSGSEERDTQA